MTIELDGVGVTIPQVVAVARRGERVELSDAALQRMAESREIVERLAQGDPAYGVSTGFGALANTTIPLNRRVALQRALIRSHAAGMGEAVEPEVVRAMMFLRARTLARSFRYSAFGRPDTGRTNQRWDRSARSRTRFARRQRRSRPIGSRRAGTHG